MRRKNGFTLIELLVVIGIIGLLIGLAAPSLLSGRQAGLIAKCLTQQSQMVKAWKTYSTNHRQWLPTPQTEEKLDWVHASVRDQDEDIPDNKDWRDIAIERGTLGPFVNSKGLYKCPSDPRSKHKWSYLMNNFLGPHRGYSVKKPVRRMGELQYSSQTMVFIDVDDKRDYNKDAFRISSLKFKDSANFWVHPPATWHNYGTVLSFADGHADSIAWASKETGKINDFYAGGSEGDYNPVNQPDNPDLRKIQEVYDPGRWEDNPSDDN